MDVEKDEPEVLGVRETAERLGVHPNTIRNWARSGQLPTARIPGARFHRFDARDVERLRQQRGRQVASVADERAAIGPELVDGTQLSQWAATREAQATFPELIRRLLVASPGVTNISMRAGDGVAARGWDGRADVAGHAFLPDGSLRFELGVSERPKSKADDDFEKRKTEPDADQHVFVFVTPRRWAGANEWETARRAEAAFRDIRVLDADDLEAWLQATPAVHYWISEHLGRRPSHARTLADWWSRFAGRTDPPLPRALFLAGRDRARDKLKEFLGQPPGVLTVQASWRDDAVAFVAATTALLDSETDAFVPTLVISSPDVWERVLDQPGRLTLLPTFENPDLDAAQRFGHHIIVPTGGGQISRGETIELERPDRQAAAAALESVGLPSDRAYALAGLARRSMPALVRSLASEASFARPAWSQAPLAATIGPLVLLGRWTTSDPDVAVVGQVVGQPWPDIERTLLQFRTAEDPPFINSNGQWHVASHEDALLVLRDSISAHDLARWHDAIAAVLLEVDPRVDLPPEERFSAGWMGVARDHSATLRTGIAEAIAIVGSLEGALFNDGVTGANHARRAVHGLLERAAGDPSGRMWRSLGDILPLLGEAAPSTFLDYVHDDLDRDEPLLATMFQDAGRDSWMYGNTPHTGLLWALENVAWSADHFLEATTALARLDQLDPGGRLSNRPLNSLSSILVIWIRHSAAPTATRLQAVDLICRDQPDVGWKLVMQLWPEHHATAAPPHSPRFRDWKPESRSVLVSEWLELIDGLVSHAVELAGTDVERWAELVGRIHDLPPEPRTKLIEALEAVADPATLAADGRVAIWERLHTEIARHRRFASADWAMGHESLARLEALADRIEPKQSVERFAYLFDWRPDLTDVDDDNHAAYEARVLELQSAAVRETIESDGLGGLRALAQRSPVPDRLGWVLGMVSGDELTPDLLAWLDADDTALATVAGSWAQRKLYEHGVPWLRTALSEPNAQSRPRRNALALRVPETVEMWDALEDVDPALGDFYWQHMAGWRVSAADAERATRELLARDRPWVAVDLLSSNVRREGDEPTSISRELVEDVLAATLDADPAQSRSQSLGYELGLLLDYLEESGTDPAVLVRYEFLFFRLLDHHRKPRALFASLAREPSLFVDLVQRIYRGKNEPKRQLSEHDQALAQQAWWVLAHWNDKFPGQRDDGTLDADGLRRWVDDVRLALAESDRSDIGDEQVGQVLARSPVGADGIWPAEPVRELIEAIGSESLVNGIHVGVVNSRGVTSRNPYDGGDQERALAAKYRDWQHRTAGTWRRTSRMLRGLAEGYELDAQREDARAELSADTE